MNVILIIFDTLRPDFTSLRNGMAQTPHLDDFAAESAVFRRAYPESLPTMCVRRAIHSGKRTYPAENYMPRKGDPVQIPGWMPLHEHQPTVAETLLEAGYRTSLISDTWHYFKPSMNFLRGFTQWDLVRGQVLDFYRSDWPTEAELEPWTVDGIKGTAAYQMLAQYKANTRGRTNETEWSAAQVFIRAAEWLTHNRNADKLFLCVDCFDPHEPWDAPQDYVDRYAPDYVGKKVISPMYGSTEYLSDAELEHIRALYAAEVSLVDRWFGYFMQKVSDLNLLDNTVIAVISDHGICLGEHNLIGKLPWGLYPEVMDLMCMVRPPGGLPVRCDTDAIIYNCDVIPTLFDYAGVAPHPMDGFSLRPLVEGRSGVEGRSYATSMFLDHAWARNDRYWYIARTDGSEPQLYDMSTESPFAQDIADSETSAVGQMRQFALDAAGGSFPTYEPVPVSALGARWYKQFQMTLTKNTDRRNG